MHVGLHTGLLLLPCSTACERLGPYEETIALVAGFADPILTGDVTSGQWEPARRPWLP